MELEYWNNPLMLVCVGAVASLIIVWVGYTAGNIAQQKKQEAGDLIAAQDDYVTEATSKIRDNIKELQAQVAELQTLLEEEISNASADQMVEMIENNGFTEASTVCS